MINVNVRFYFIREYRKVSFPLFREFNFTLYIKSRYQFSFLFVFFLLNIILKKRQYLNKCFKHNSSLTLMSIDIYGRVYNVLFQIEATSSWTTNYLIINNNSVIIISPMYFFSFYIFQIHCEWRTTNKIKKKFSQ